MKGKGKKRTDKVDLHNAIHYFDVRLTEIKGRLLVACRLSAEAGKAPTPARIRRAQSAIYDVQIGQQILMLELLDLCAKLAQKGDDDED
jgi:hypothetical protein